MRAHSTLVQVKLFLQNNEFTPFCGGVVPPSLFSLEHSRDILTLGDQRRHTQTPLPNLSGMQD